MEKECDLEPQGGSRRLIRDLLGNSQGSAESSLLERATGHLTLVHTKRVFQLLEVLMKPWQAVVTQSVGQGQPAHSPKRNLITRAGPVRPQADPAAASRGYHPREPWERGSFRPSIPFALSDQISDGPWLFPRGQVFSRVLRTVVVNTNTPHGWQKY